LNINPDAKKQAAEIIAVAIMDALVAFGAVLVLLSHITEG